MSGNSEVSESRTQALLKEAATSEAEKRSAGVTLAGMATVATGWSEEAEAAGLWDEEAAKAMTRDALEIAGLVPYEPGQPYKQRGIETLTTNYERPGQ